MEQNKSVHVRTLWMAASLALAGSLTACGNEEEPSVNSVSSAFIPSSAPVANTNVTTGTTSASTDNLAATNTPSSAETTATTGTGTETVVVGLNTNTSTATGTAPSATTSTNVGNASGTSTTTVPTTNGTTATTSPPSSSIVAVVNPPVPVVVTAPAAAPAAATGSGTTATSSGSTSAAATTNTSTAKPSTSTTGSTAGTTATGSTTTATTTNKPTTTTTSTSTTTASKPTTTTTSSTGTSTSSTTTSTSASSSSTATTSTTTNTTATATNSATTTSLGLPDCTAGKGTDYQVGAGKAYPTLDAVPWESLKAGDTVRIFYSATPYKGKFMVAAAGTAAAPVRICGVKGPSGERPIIDGSNATTRKALLTAYGNSAQTQQIHQGRSIINVKALASGAYESVPSWIVIDGLNIRAGHPKYNYTDASGATRPYDPFGACIWVDRGHNITIADNEISDCQMAVYTKSLDDGDFAVTKNIRIAGNYMWGHGIVGDEHMHTTYTESLGIVMEYNRYGPLRTGSLGNSIKDRSAGMVVRYNRIEGGARAIDMVEAEDFPTISAATPAYRTSFVYGNQIKKNGDEGSFFHYGGDHFGATAGANWGESLFRRGTLYFFNNTVYGTGKSARLFQISTTQETVEAWNNVFWFDSTVTEINLRQAENDSLASSYTPDGILNLGVNWIKTGWTDTTQWKTLKGQVKGTGNLITGSTAPFDTATFMPLSGSAIIDAGQANLTAVSAHPVAGQLVTQGNMPQATARAIKGTRIDLGAVER